MVFLKFELKKGLNGVKEFRLVTKLFQMNCLLDHLPNLVHLSKSLCHPKWEMFCSSWGIKRIFSHLFRCRG